MINNIYNMSLYNKINNFIAKNIFLLLFIVLLFIFFNKKNNNRQVDNTRQVNTRQINTRQVNNISFDSRMANNRAMLSSNNMINHSDKDKKIVKQFNINIVVNNVKKTQEHLNELLLKYDGYIENFYSYEYENSKAINFTIKVPTNKLEKYIADIKNDVYVKNESFSAVDFSKQYFDNENTLKNLYIRRDKLRVMMEKDAKKLTDVIAIDKELNSVQNEIEILEKRNNKIQKDVDYSQINLTIEPNIVENKNINKWNLKKAIADSINLLILVCQMIIHYFIVFVVFLPLIIVSFVLFVVIKKSYLYFKKCIKR